MFSWVLIGSLVLLGSRVLGTLRVLGTAFPDAQIKVTTQYRKMIFITPNNIKHFIGRSSVTY